MTCVSFVLSAVIRAAPVAAFLFGPLVFSFCFQTCAYMHVVVDFNVLLQPLFEHVIRTEKWGLSPVENVGWPIPLTILAHDVFTVWFQFAMSCPGSQNDCDVIGLPPCAKQTRSFGNFSNTPPKIMLQIAVVVSAGIPSSHTQHDRYVLIVHIFGNVRGLRSH